MGDSQARPRLVSVPETPTSVAPRSEHIVQFYGNVDFLGETVSRFLAEGLAQDASILVVATPEHLEVFKAGLAAKGFDVDRGRASGQMTFLDAQATMDRFLDGDEPDWDRFLATVGGVVAQCVRWTSSGRVRAYGEMVDLLWRQGRPQAAVRVEECWNRLGRKFPISLLCAYVMGNFFKESDSNAFRHVCELHERVLPSEGYRQGADEETRLREISFLQQRSMALETELLRRKELEEALRSSHEKAEQASRAKDEFLAMLGHELRNPLAPILTAVELIKVRGGGRLSREHAIIERQSRHLVRLVDDLLDVSSLTRGAFELRRQRVDLRDVLARAAAIVAPLLEIRQHRFRIDTPLVGTFLANADEARLAQVVANLLTNAAKYTPPGGNILLAARTEAREAIVEVKDDGGGIAPDLLPRIFDLFVQGRQEADRGTGGLGIGLALVRSLVELHGGTVTAHSEGPGYGSVFRIRLPLAPPAEAAPSEKALRGASSRRILVVDDNADALEMLAELLRIEGHEVQAALDGPAALDRAREFRPEVAILDLGLPGMDGYELARRLRAQLGESAPAIFALTGYGQEADRKRCEAAGFARHLLKPLEADELLAAIASTP